VRLTGIKESVLIAFGTFRAHKMRSFLTILGVLIGVTTIIGMVSIIKGLDRSMARQIESLGSNIIYVSKYRPGIQIGNRSDEERNRKGITFEDAVAIKESCPAVEAVSPQNYYFRPGGNYAKYGNVEVTRPMFFGTVPEYETVNNSLVQEGRFITDADVKFRAYVCVLGHDVSQTLFQHLDPVGKKILVNGNRFTVVGVMEKKEELLGSGQANNFVLIPYDTFAKIHPEEKELSLAVKARSPRLIPAAIDEITELMRRRRGVRYNEPDDFAVFTQENLMDIYKQLTGIIYMAMIVISSIGLLVGGVGVMNIMLVSVTERTREIGIRKAIGARKADILWQFLIEASSLSGLGGILGIILGTLFAQFVAVVSPLPAAVSLPWVLIGFGFSVGVALIFGIYPAYRASKLNPIECLRYE
jgi:putative ABC transport system permease protein